MFFFWKIILAHSAFAVVWTSNVILAGNNYADRHIKLFRSNWNNKININKNGILYTSSRLVGTSVEDFADKQKEKRTFKLNHWATRDETSRINSLLVWTSREYVGWTPFLFILILLFELDLNSFIIRQICDL